MSALTAMSSWIASAPSVRGRRLSSWKRGLGRRSSSNPRPTDRCRLSDSPAEKRHAAGLATPKTARTSLQIWVARGHNQDFPTVRQHALRDVHS
jgi:hypothetical protein